MMMGRRRGLYTYKRVFVGQKQEGREGEEVSRHRAKSFLVDERTKGASLAGTHEEQLTSEGGDNNGKGGHARGSRGFAA